RGDPRGDRHRPPGDPAPRLTTSSPPSGEGDRYFFAAAVFCPGGGIGTGLPSGVIGLLFAPFSKCTNTSQSISLEQPLRWFFLATCEKYEPAGSAVSAASPCCCSPNVPFTTMAS